MKAKQKTATDRILLQTETIMEEEPTISARVLTHLCNVREATACRTVLKVLHTLPYNVHLGPLCPDAI